MRLMPQLFSDRMVGRSALHSSFTFRISHFRVHVTLLYKHKHLFSPLWQRRWRIQSIYSNRSLNLAIKPMCNFQGPFAYSVYFPILLSKKGVLSLDWLSFSICVAHLAIHVLLPSQTVPRVSFSL